MPAPSLSYALSLAVAEGTASGLLAGNGAAPPSAINLFEIGGVIYGSTAASGATDPQIITAAVFTIGVATDGVVTLTQISEIQHQPPGATAAPYDTQLAILADGLVELTATATITDGDDDTATDSATIDLGGNIKFADDGPSIDVVAGADAGVMLITQDAETDGDPSAEDTAVSMAAFGSVFSFTSTTGADGAGMPAPSLSYALSLAVAEGTASGLLAGNGAAPPSAINLFEIGGVIYGSTAASGATDPQIITAAVFTIGVATDGVVTLTQISEIQHQPPGATAAPYDTPACHPG